TQRRQTLTAITDLDQTHPEPDNPTQDHLGPSDTTPLAALPYLALNLRHARPTPLYEITGLTIQLHPDTHQATITIMLPADHLHQVSAAATEAGHPQAAGSVDAGCAPGGIRTHTVRVLRPLPLPIGLGGQYRA